MRAGFPTAVAPAGTLKGKVYPAENKIFTAKESGYEVIQSGRGHGVRGDGKFAYLSTEDDLFTVYELMELVSERYPPERVYPEQTE